MVARHRSRGYLQLLLPVASLQLAAARPLLLDATSTAGLVDGIGGSWRAQPLHVPTLVAKQSDAVDGPLLGNGAVGAVLGGPANNLTWYLGANRFFGGPSSGSSHCGYHSGGALQLGGLTVQTSSPLLANASWTAGEHTRHC